MTRRGAGALRGTAWTERFSSPGPAISLVPSVREICAMAGASFCSSCAIRSTRSPPVARRVIAASSSARRRSSSAVRSGGAGARGRSGAAATRGFSNGCGGKGGGRERAVPIASTTSILPRPLLETRSEAPSCRRSRTARTNFITASCTRSTSLEVPRSALRTMSATSRSARYAVESLRESFAALICTRRGSPLEASKAAPSNSRGSSASISRGTSTIRASGRAVSFRLNTPQSYDAFDRAATHTRR